MSLLDYCTTERQTQIITLHLEGLGYQKIGDKLGVSKWVARDIIKNIKRRWLSLRINSNGLPLRLPGTSCWVV